MFPTSISLLILVLVSTTPVIKASTNCLGGPALGLEAACDFQNFNGLQGHPASEILYQIIMQSPLDNNTFFANESHVTCLFRDSNFLLNGFGGGTGTVSFQLGGITVPGTLCVFPTGVKEGGLRLGEIRQLAAQLISESGGDCSKCGRISVNDIFNESRTGWLEFDWDDNAGCSGNCIDPAKIIAATTTASANATPTSSAAKKFLALETWLFGLGALSLLLAADLL